MLPNRKMRTRDESFLFNVPLQNEKSDCVGSRLWFSICYICHAYLSTRFSVKSFLLIFIYTRNDAVFDTEERAAAQVFYDLFIQFGRGDEELYVVNLADEELLSV